MFLNWWDLIVPVPVIGKIVQWVRVLEESVGVWGKSQKLGLQQKNFMVIFQLFIFMLKYCDSWTY